MSDANLRAPYLVCEIANSHSGDETIVRTLIDKFAKLNYQTKGIKFQVFRADTLALPDFDWYSVYQELEFSEATWRDLIAAAAMHGDVWIDVFDRFGAQIVKQNIDSVAGLKLQASVLENEEVLSELSTMSLVSKHIAINVSGFELEDIRRFVDVYENLSASLVLQIGFQSYPTKIEDTALQKISTIRTHFPEHAIGFADHADGTSDFAKLVPLYASLLGCTFLEKHLCLSREVAKYDGYSALEPEEMQFLCTRLNEVASAGAGPFVGAAEERYLNKSVQVPVLRHQIRTGTRVDLTDLAFRRTSQRGIAWLEIDTLQSKRRRLASSVEARTTLSKDQFRIARVAAIVACRMKSVRLPKKAILPIAGIPSVERCLNQCLGAAGVQQVILATSTLQEDSVLADYVCGGRAKFWTGDPDDVIARYIGACDHFGVDVIVRVTADCPLVSTEIIEYLLEKHFENAADYTAAIDVAVGTGCEIIEASALRTVIERLGRANYSEYMTWYFKNNPETFRLNIVNLPSEMVRDYRLTLDHPEDLEVIERIMLEIGDNRNTYRLRDVFAILDAQPDISQLNAHIELKYVADQRLISMLNERTRISAIDDADLERGN